MESSESLQQLISAQSENPPSHYIESALKNKRGRESWKVGHQEEGELKVKKESEMSTISEVNKVENAIWETK